MDGDDFARQSGITRTYQCLSCLAHFNTREARYDHEQDCLQKATERVHVALGRAIPPAQVGHA